MPGTRGALRLQPSRRRRACNTDAATLAHCPEIGKAPGKRCGAFPVLVVKGDAAGRPVSVGAVPINNLLLLGEAWRRPTNALPLYAELNFFLRFQILLRQSQMIVGCRCGVKIDKGCFLGYRRTDHAGTWIARWRDEDGLQHYQAIGPADDIRDPDGVSVLTFSQAQRRAHEFFDHKARELADGYTSRDTYTVSDALRDHFKNRERRASTATEW